MRVAIHIIWAAEKDATAAEQPLSALMSQSESASLDDVDLKSVCCSLLGVGQAYVRRMVKPSQRHISGFFDCTPGRARDRASQGQGSKWSWTVSMAGEESQFGRVHLNGNGARKRKPVVPAYP